MLIQQNRLKINFSLFKKIKDKYTNKRISLT